MNPENPQNIWHTFALVCLRPALMVLVGEDDEEASLATRLAPFEGSRVGMMMRVASVPKGAEFDNVAQAGSAMLA